MTPRQTRYTGWLIHTLVWAVVIFMPLFRTSPDRPMMAGSEYVRFLLIPLSFMAVFYLNYFLLIDRLLVRRRMGMFVILNVLLIAVVMTAVHLLFRYVLPPDFHHPPKMRTLMDSVAFFGRNASMYVLVAGASVAVRMTAGWYRTEAERKDLEHRRSEAELQNLRSQLNPHFLFNTLNNIYSLIQIDPVRAQSAVHDLSHLLRYVLYGGSRESVPLQDEVDFINEYVALMRMRLPQSVDVRVELPVAASGMMIAPLLFISLVENAFKHGTGAGDHSFVHISLTVEGQRVVCACANSYFPVTAEKDRSGSGIGLTNLRRRLEMIYPGRHELSCGRVGDEYRARLVIDLG